MDITTLENWLWDAACSIRGPLDAPRYNDYILPLLFFKRLSDVYGRVDWWAQRLDVQPGRVQVQPMRRKWVSMSTQGNRTLARALLYLPLELVDYVIVHELLHLKFPNHRKGFQAVLDYTLPGWRQREERLNTYVDKDVTKGRRDRL